jgi:hypothetical protein
MEFSNFVTKKEVFKLYLKLCDDSKFEIIGDQEDLLICPYIWSAFKKSLKA